MQLLAKIVRETVGFITDDLVTAALVIIWVVAFALLVRTTHHNGIGIALIYLAGLLLSFCFGVWRRTRS